MCVGKSATTKRCAIFSGSSSKEGWAENVTNKHDLMYTLLFYKILYFYFCMYSWEIHLSYSFCFSFELFQTNVFMYVIICKEIERNTTNVVYNSTSRKTLRMQGRLTLNVKISNVRCTALPISFSFLLFLSEIVTS